MNRLNTIFCIKNKVDKTGTGRLINKLTYISMVTKQFNFYITISDRFSCKVQRNDLFYIYKYIKICDMMFEMGHYCAKYFSDQMLTFNCHSVIFVGRAIIKLLRCQIPLSPHTKWWNDE